MFAAEKSTVSGFHESKLLSKEFYIAQLSFQGYF